jgi:hypothetical protein
MMAKKPLSSLASVLVTVPFEGVAPTPPISSVQRESLHVRLPIETVERVHEASYRLRRQRQDIADEALREWLAARSF